MAEVKREEAVEKERRKMEMLEKSFSYSYLDILFPYHMYLGRHERKDADNEYALTSLKTFNRRRMMLLLLLNRKFDKILTEYERTNVAKAEEIVWNESVKYKAISLFLIMHLRLFKRPQGRSWFFDFCLLYGGIWSWLLSGVMGEHKTWPLIEGSA